MKKHSHDYLLVGLGLAGSTLALTLIREGKNIMVIDAPEYSASSKVAAGVYHPANFRSMLPSWNAEAFLPFAKQFWTEAEELLGAKFHHARTITRVFLSAAEAQLWTEKTAQHQSPFFTPGIIADPLPGKISAPFGAGLVEGGNIEATVFLEATRTFLRKKNALLEETFVHNRLEEHPGGATYDDIHARHVIFCEGYRMQQNPFFSGHALRTTKGQVLHIHVPGLDTAQVYNREVFILALGNERYTAGATFERGVADELPTEEGRAELEEKLKILLDVPFTVEAQKAGVRPAVYDHKPLIGMHPQQPQLGLFNGMGSKAVLWAPLLAKELVEHLEKGTALSEEYSILRRRKRG